MDTDLFSNNIYSPDALHATEPTTSMQKKTLLTKRSL